MLTGVANRVAEVPVAIIRGVAGRSRVANRRGIANRGWIADRTWVASWRLEVPAVAPVRVATRRVIAMLHGWAAFMVVLSHIVVLLDRDADFFHVVVVLFDRYVNMLHRNRHLDMLHVVVILLDRDANLLVVVVHHFLRSTFNFRRAIIDWRAIADWRAVGDRRAVADRRAIGDWRAIAYRRAFRHWLEICVKVRNFELRRAVWLLRCEADRHRLRTAKISAAVMLLEAAILVAVAPHLLFATELAVAANQVKSMSGCRQGTEAQTTKSQSCKETFHDSGLLNG